MVEDSARREKRAGLYPRFVADRRGNIVVLFAFSLVALALAVGAAIDLARAYNAQQKLYQTATLACQYASRPSVIQTASSHSGVANGFTTYVSKVNAFVTTTLQGQNFQYTQTTVAPFSAAQNGAANVHVTANVPTTFMQIAQFTQLPVSASVHCYDTPSSVNPVTTGPYVMQETFGVPICSGCGWVFYPGAGATVSISGHGSTIASANSTPSSTIGYTGITGTNWVIMGFCLEVDTVNTIFPNVPIGTQSAELDCDNGSGSAGNSSISTRQYLPAGNYELRYFYNSRVDYPNYDPTHLCGSSANDLSWANDDKSSGGPAANAVRDNQVNAYLDEDFTGVPPRHQTIDKTQYLGGANLIDVCVYNGTGNWVERSVRVTIATADWYWLSFAADGQNNSYGPSIANIRLCSDTCPNSVQDNFPPDWLASTTLFQDTFGSFSGNLNTSTVTRTGWPNLSLTAPDVLLNGVSPNGWATASYNQINSTSNGIELTGTTTPSKRLISRPFLLDPGYYKITYDYISDGVFSPSLPSGLSDATCATMPQDYAKLATSFAPLQTGTSVLARSRPSGSYATTTKPNSNMIGLFMAHFQKVSLPNGGNTSPPTVVLYDNLDGTQTTTAKAPPDAISLTNYNSAQANPLLDICAYASASQKGRTANILITKSAYYWLTASSLGAPASGYGGVIDNVKLVALGSPFMSSPPSSVVTIPVPDPQPELIDCISRLPNRR